MKFLRLPAMAVSAILGLAACSEDANPIADPGNAGIPYGSEIPGDLHTDSCAGSGDKWVHIFSPSVTIYFCLIYVFSFFK